jgi:hypothetical protein
MDQVRAALAVRRTGHVRLPEFLGVLALAAFVCLGAYTDINFLVLMHLPVFQDLDIYLAACRTGLHGGNVYANLSLGYGFLYPLPSLLLMLPVAPLPHDFIRVVLYDGVNIALSCSWFGRWRTASHCHSDKPIDGIYSPLALLRFSRTSNSVKSICFPKRACCLSGCIRRRSR